MEPAGILSSATAPETFSAPAAAIREPLWPRWLLCAAASGLRSAATCSRNQFLSWYSLSGFYPHCAGGRADRSGDDVDHGGFARAVVAHQTDHLAGVDVERDVPKGGDVAVGFGTLTTRSTGSVGSGDVARAIVSAGIRRPSSRFSFDENSCLVAGEWKYTTMVVCQSFLRP